MPRTSFNTTKKAYPGSGRQNAPIGSRSCRFYGIPAGSVERARCGREQLVPVVRHDHGLLEVGATDSGNGLALLDAEAHSRLEHAVAVGRDPRLLPAQRRRMAPR